MDDLERTIKLLKKSLAAAWCDLARSSTSLDKREIRAQAKRCSEELRRCLLILEARQTREHVKALSDYAGRARPKPDLRFLLVDAAKERPVNDRVNDLISSVRNRPETKLPDCRHRAENLQS